jgi:hypothetical protein
MNPSQKYMPNNRNITDEDDIKLVPFINDRQPPPTDQSNFAMSTTGWIPVYFFNPPQAGNTMWSGMQTSTGGASKGVPSPSPFNGALPILPNMNSIPNEDIDNNNSALNSEKFYTFNPLATPSNRELPNIIELLSNFDLDLDEDVDLVRNCSDKGIDRIYEKIEKNHPEIFALVRAYNIPYPIFKLLIRRVIKLSVNYCKKEEA